MADQYTTLNEVVKSALGDRGETPHLYASYLRQAIKGYREFNFDHALEIKSVLLEMLPYNAITLPCDFVDWVKVGIPAGDHIAEFSPGQNINRINPVDAYGREVMNTRAPGEQPYPLYDYYQSLHFALFFNDKGENPGRRFGAGSANPLGYFEVKKDKEQIQFTSDVNGTQVYLEYISSGIDPNGKTLVHWYAALCIQRWIHWQVALFNLGAASGEAQALRKEYFDQLRIYKARMSPLTPRLILETANKSYKLSPKS